MIALGALAIFGVSWGKAALIGGGVFFVSNALFTICAFIFSGVRSAKKIVASFFIGETLKITTTVGLFACVYFYMPLDLIPLKFAYVLALIVNIFGPANFVNQQ
jgi:ATP synthase protein I